MISGGLTPSRSNSSPFGSLLETLNIPAHLRDSIRNLTPLTEEQVDAWKELAKRIVETSDNVLIRAFIALNEIIGPASTSFASSLLWRFYRPSQNWYTMIAIDKTGKTLTIERMLRVSDSAEVIDLMQSTSTFGKPGEIVVTKDAAASTWVIFLNPDGPLSSDDQIDGRTPPPLYIPAEHIRDVATAEDMARDTIILLRSVLEELGFYKSGAAFNENIRIINPISGDLNARHVHFGYKVKPLSDTSWVPLFSTPPKENSGRITDGEINPLVSPATARVALSNLYRIAHTLKNLGIVMKSWGGIQVNPATGELSLGEADMPALLNSDALAKALDNNLEDATPPPSEWNAPYIPNLAALSTNSIPMTKGERELVGLIKLLRRRSGDFLQRPSRETINQQLMNDFELFANMSTSYDFRNLVSQNYDAIQRIIEFYTQKVGVDLDVPIFNGALRFLTHILPAICLLESPDKWYEAASLKIEEALKVHGNNQVITESYWDSKSTELWRFIRFRRSPGGSGQGGSTPQGASGGGMGATGSSNGNSAAQAHPHSITGFYETASQRAEKEINGFYVPDSQRLSSNAEFLYATTPWAWSARGLYDRYSSIYGVNSSNAQMQSLLMAGGMMSLRPASVAGGVLLVH